MRKERLKNLKEAISASKISLELGEYANIDKNY
jgi:hypothetical protein